MREISNGARSVPVISVGDKVFIGFDQEALSKELDLLESK